MAWRANLLGIVLLAGAAPALAQPGPAPDPRELSREFGAFGDPAKAETLIADCDAQAARVRQIGARWRQMIDASNAEEAAFRRAEAAYERAATAMREAEDRAATLGGDALARFTTDVLAERRRRLEEAKATRDTASGKLNAASHAGNAEAREIGAYLRSIGVPAAMISSATPASLLQDRLERCQRLRAWAQLGARSRARADQPAPGAWPGIVAAAWQGQWSCQWRSLVNGMAQTMTVSTRIHVLKVSPDTASVYLSTQLSRWPPAWPSSVFSPLEVRRERPLHGAFENRPELDEGRAGYDVVDTADVAADGVLTFRRIHSADPGRTETSSVRAAARCNRSRRCPTAPVRAGLSLSWP